MAKKRTSIPTEISAQVLFDHDRTCCVCRLRGKPVQIHHIDEDPRNHAIQNLAVLCLDCHRETQIRGGFDRKLDGNQIRLYREDWLRLVRHQRAVEEVRWEVLQEDSEQSLAVETSIAEIYRENGEYVLLAGHYNQIGNRELRDKYIELCLSQDPTDDTIVFLRDLQGHSDRIPKEVIKREEARHTQNRDYNQRARFYQGLGRHSEAVAEYIRGILKSLREKRAFSAAYYLKELQESDLLRELFVIALKQAQEEKNLWWQVRVLQELGWTGQLQELIISRADEIKSSGDLLLLLELAWAEGDTDRHIELRKQLASRSRGTCILPLGKSEENEADSK